MATLTRFRSSDRDGKTDKARLESVERALRNALASIAREQGGLSRRLDESSTRVASLMGTEDGIYYEREAADEEMLVEAEAQMMQAYRRLNELKAQRILLAGLLDQIGPASDPYLEEDSNGPGGGRSGRSFVDERQGKVGAPTPVWWRSMFAVAGGLIVAAIAYDSG